METIAEYSMGATIMAAQGPAWYTTRVAHSMVGGAMVGRSRCLQAQRGRLRLEQLGKLGIVDLLPEFREKELALTRY